jgi:GT2 family glycosyltransferase
VVYVDSGSTDGSAEWASSHGASVVELDMNTPFTAARARNAGFERLSELATGLELVQFVDGDCEVAPGWLERAAAALRSNPCRAVVCGRRRERFPERSVYNQLCDMEWDTPVGPTESCGGDAMMRASAFREVGGFRPDLIAGEEPELCFRLRRAGWTVERLDAEMTRHDADMTRFREWWRRAVRSGHAYAERYALHGAPPERAWLRNNVSIFASGFAAPALAAAAAIPTAGLALLAPPAL